MPTHVSKSHIYIYIYSEGNEIIAWCNYLEPLHPSKVGKNLLSRGKVPPYHS